MNVRIVTDDTLLDKIDEVKNRLGIKVNKYSTAIGMICDVVLADLELKKKYTEAMENLFSLLQESNSGSVDMSSESVKEGLLVYQSIAR